MVHKGRYPVDNYPDWRYPVSQCWDYRWIGHTCALVTPRFDVFHSLFNYSRRLTHWSKGLLYSNRCFALWTLTRSQGDRQGMERTLNLSGIKGIFLLKILILEFYIWSKLLGCCWPRENKGHNWMENKSPVLLACQTKFHPSSEEATLGYNFLSIWQHNSVFSLPTCRETYCFLRAGMARGKEVSSFPIRTIFRSCTWHFPKVT